MFQLEDSTILIDFIGYLTSSVNNTISTKEWSEYHNALSELKMFVDNING